jgi:hypothetical protein
MPLFVSPADVILRMQLSAELTGLEEVVASGIIGAQLHVERLLGCKLQRQSQDCQYYIDGDAFSGITPGGVFRLELPSGFMRRDTNVVVTATESDQLNTIGPFDAFAAVDTDYLRIDHDRGYILMDAASFANSYVRVRCDTGFEDGTTPYPLTGIDAYDDEATYAVGDRVVYAGVVYTCLVATEPGDSPTDLLFWARTFVPMDQIPMALYEAIMALVPLAFNSSQTTTRSNEAQQQYKVATDHASMLLQSYIRTRGFSFRPV